MEQAHERKEQMQEPSSEKQLMLSYPPTDPQSYPWKSRFLKLYNDDQPSCSLVIRTSVLKQLNLPPDTPILLEKGAIDRVSRPWEILPTGHKIGTPEPLFKELVLKQLNLPPDTPILLERGDIDRVSRPWEILPTGHKIRTPEPLFKELV
nr:methionine--trna ligase, cytoplasmic [Quercus suber]